MSGSVAALIGLFRKTPAAPARRVAARPQHATEIRRPMASTVRAEYRARGFKSAYALYKAKRKFNGVKRDSALDQVARLLENEMSITEAVDHMWKLASDDGRKPNNPLALVYTDWAMKIADGHKLYSALADWLPPFGRPIFEASEQSGSIPKAIDNYLYVSKSIKEIKSTVWSGLFGPILLLGMAIMYLYIVAYDLGPTFAQAVPMDKWTGSLSLLGWMSVFTQHYMPFVGIAFGALGIWITWSMARWTRSMRFIGRYRQKFDFHAPWSIYRMVYGANFMLSFSALYGSGVKDPDILRILMRTANPWYRERLASALRHVDGGLSIGEAMHRTGFMFPDREIVAALRSYSKSGNLNSVLERISRQWVAKNIQGIKTAMAGVNAVGMVLSGFFVILIMESSFNFSAMVSSMQ